MSDPIGESGTVVVFGDGASGKTCLLKQYVDGRFEPRYKATVALDILSKTVEVGSRTVSLNFFDFAGQERFAASAPHVVKKAHCFVFTFDVSSRKSFSRLEHWWARSLPYYTAAHVVVGTKTDVAEHQVSEEEVESWCREHGGIPHVLVSAKANANVDVAFDFIGRLVLARLESSADESIADSDQPGAAAHSHIGADDDLASRVDGALPSALTGAGHEDGGVMSMVAVGSDEESDDGLLKFCTGDEGQWGSGNSGTVG